MEGLWASYTTLIKAVLLSHLCFLQLDNYEIVNAISFHSLYFFIPPFLMRIDFI